MAKLELYFKELLKHEGGLVNHPDDPGGLTNKGITLATWMRYGVDLDGDGDVDSDDLKILTDEAALRVYVLGFWNKLRASEIKDQALAEIIFDHGVNAGISRAVKMTQMLLNRFHGKRLVVDGKSGPNTIGAINSVNAKVLYNQFRELRISYYNFLANRLEGLHDWEMIFFRNALRVAPRNRNLSFIVGWLNRANSFKKKV